MSSATKGSAAAAAATSATATDSTALDGDLFAMVSFACDARLQRSPLIVERVVVPPCRQQLDDDTGDAAATAGALDGIAGYIAQQNASSGSGGGLFD